MFDPADMDPDTELFLEPNDAAKRLDRSPSTVRRYSEEGRLAPAGRTLRGVRLYRAEDVEVLRRELQARKDPRRLREASVHRLARHREGGGLSNAGAPAFVVDTGGTCSIGTEVVNAAR
jgi:MerR family regulatory protein